MIHSKKKSKTIAKIIAPIIGIATPWVALAQGSGAISNSLGNLRNASTGVYGGAGGASDIFGFVNKVIVTFFALLAVIFLGMMLYAGYNWMTAMGDSEKVTKAKDTLITASIGLVIVLAAYAITTFVFSSLTSTTMT